MNNRFTKEQIPQFIENLGCDKEPLMRCLVEQLLSFDLEGMDNEVLLIIACKLYEFIQNFNGKKGLVEVYNLDSKNLQDQFTVVQTLSKDIPFLVDSITEELKSTGLVIHKRWNLVISTSRQDGELTAIMPAVDAESAGKALSKESLMCSLLSKVDDDELLQLKPKISGILQKVAVCVEDWPLMVQHANETKQVVMNNTLATKEDCQETADFLDWLNQHNFVLLGCARFSYLGGKIVPEEGSELGTFRFSPYNEHFRDDVLLDKYESPVYVTRSNMVSYVHRRTNLDLIRIPIVSERAVVGEVAIIGLFASVVYFQDALQIPIIRKKASDITKASGFPKGGHNDKALTAIIQDLPRTELLHIPATELLECCMGIMSLAMTSRLRVFVFHDSISSFIRCMVFIPRGQFNTPIWVKMQKLISEYFAAEIVNEQMRGSHMMRLQLIMSSSEASENKDAKGLESILLELLTGWYENLKQCLIKAIGNSEGDRLSQRYTNAFMEGYKQDFTPRQAVHDIRNLEKLDDERYAEADLYVRDGEYQLKVYTCSSDFNLSDMIPVIENMGMRVLDHNSYLAQLVGENRTLWVHHFYLKTDGMMFLELDQIKEQFETTLVMVWHQRIENDYYNSLIILAGLTWKEVVLLRAWGKYLQQIRFSYSQDYIRRTLSRYPEIVSCLIQLFHARFNPEVQGVENENREKLLANKLEKFLQKVESLADDKIIRSMINLNAATLRTNFYLNKNYVSFKLDSQQINNLPLPRPFVEIYVYSTNFEAVHLRGGKVARGGLRWSDRFEDFRTEVLGLMKAQMPKNTVIVPVGSKGGFIVKINEEDKDKYRAKVVECYQNFLRALLDITDNVVAGEPQHPQGIVCRDDGYDPYLVIAADKGTATFSDYANEVSGEYDFWLGDAFASGGSSGYDHKAMGITAKGAWVAVERHFWEMRQDIHNNPFTVVGIGDMSGDVFGNGMLLSNQIKLVAAFNHLHIFVDPDPDPAASFAERKRLFENPGLSWDSYDTSLLSEGAEVFARKSKSLKLNEHIKKRFGITQDSLNPDELIKCLLKAKVDLIWNGGIGTFVMSSNETNEMVGDKANDNIRITGKELRATIVGEGGNLGLTQLGRIEFANNGGHINTDFIDNSAGVSCSDMEVNIKIALSAAMEKQLISLEERNVLLSTMEKEVGRMILRKYNDLQTKSLTVQCLQAQYTRLEQYQRLISRLEKCGLLNRKVEFLPTDEELAQMYAEKRGLTRPQLAVLTAYAKMNLYDAVVRSDLPELEYFNRYLIQYFPSTMQTDYQEEILAHPLKNEIITTYVTNSIIHRMGCTFVEGIAENTGLPETEIVRIYMAIRDSYDLRWLWSQIDALDDNISLKCYNKMIDAVHKFVNHAAEWFFRNYPKPINISLAIAEFSSEAKHIAEHLTTILDKESLARYNAQLKQLLNDKVPEELAVRIASLAFLGASLSITQIANNLRFHGKVQIPSLTVGRIYFYVGDHLHLSWLREMSLKIESGSYWQKVSVRSLSDDIYDKQMLITAEIAKYLNDGEDDYMDAVTAWTTRNADALERYDNFLCELKAGDSLDLSKLIVIIRRLGNIT